MKSESSIEDNSIRRQVLVALAANRTPGFHYPGHFLGCVWPRIGGDDLEETLPDAPYARNGDGTINLAAFSVLLDTAKAATPRCAPRSGTRMARGCWRG